MLKYQKAVREGGEDSHQRQVAFLTCTIALEMGGVDTDQRLSGRSERRRYPSGGAHKWGRWCRGILMILRRSMPVWLYFEKEFYCQMNERCFQWSTDWASRLYVSSARYDHQEKRRIGGNNNTQAGMFKVESKTKPNRGGGYLCEYLPLQVWGQ